MVHISELTIGFEDVDHFFQVPFPAVDFMCNGENDPSCNRNFLLSNWADGDHSWGVYIGMKLKRLAKPASFVFECNAPVGDDDYAAYWKMITAQATHAKTMLAAMTLIERMKSLVIFKISLFLNFAEYR